MLRHHGTSFSGTEQNRIILLSKTKVSNFLHEPTSTTSLFDQQQDPEYEMDWKGRAQDGKRQRHDFALEEVSVLNEEWDRGMTSSGKACEEKINNCAERLQTTVERIQMWIGNKRRKEKRMGESSVPKKTTSYTSGPNAFSLFVSKMKRGTEEKSAFFTKAAAKWRLLSEDEKQPIQEEAAMLRQDPMKGVSREKQIHMELATMSKCCDRLSSSGFHFGGIGVDTAKKSPPVVVGSHLGVQFMNNPELQAEYTRHFSKCVIS